MDIIILLIIFVIIVVVSIIIFSSKEDPHYYDKGSLELNVEKEDPYSYEKGVLEIMVKGKTKLASDIFEILSEEGYRPTFEEDGDCEWILVKIDGISISFSINKKDPNYVLIRCHTYTFDSKRRYEMFEKINQVNSNVRFICLTIQEDAIYIDCGIQFYNDINIKDVLFNNLRAVLYAYNEFWNLENDKFSLN